MGVVEVVLGLVARVRSGECPGDVIAEAEEDSSWEERRGKRLMKEYRRGRIKMLSADETKKSIDDLKRSKKRRRSRQRQRRS